MEESHLRYLLLSILVFPGLLPSGMLSLPFFIRQLVSSFYTSDFSRIHFRGA
jgi:hypothetical protein